MSVAPESRTVVVGIGNLIRTDDGAGIHALQKLERDPRLPPGVTLIDGGTHGIELSAYLSDARRLLFLDAMDVGESSGTLVRFHGPELLGLPGGKTVHELGFADLLATLSLSRTAPQEIVVLGVQPGSTDWGVALTPPVDSALASLVDEALSILAEWSKEAEAQDGSFRPRTEWPAVSEKSPVGPLQGRSR